MNVNVATPTLENNAQLVTRNDRDSVATLTLIRPTARNSLSRALMADLKAQLATARRETDGLAHEVNALRHAVRRSGVAKLLPAGATRRGSEGRAAHSAERSS